LASTSGVTKIAFDASAIIGFDEANIHMLDSIRAYFKASNHLMIVCQEIVQECKTVQPRIADSDVCNVVHSRDETFQAVKSLSRSPELRIQDNDYRCIASAIDEKCLYLVSNDMGLIAAANNYTKQKGIGLKSFTLANFLYYMYASRRDLFSWKLNIKTVAKLYHHVEMQNIVDGIKTRKWELKQARERFLPYATNIYQTIDGLP
jgi:hypothetical protein